AGPLDAINRRAGYKLSRGSVYDIIETVSVVPQHHLASIPVPIHIGENGNLHGVVVVGIIRRELKIPLEFAGVGIKGQNAIGIKIVARPLSGIPVRTRISGAPIGEVEIGIVRARDPDGRAAVLPISAFPAFVPGLAGTGNG